MSNGNGFSLGEPEFFSTSLLRKYCENGRKLIRPLHHELLISAEELQAALAELPGGHRAAMGIDTRMRARLVASHLRHAAEGVEAACGSLVRTYMSFQKHFAPELQAAQHKPRRSFDIDQ